MPRAELTRYTVIVLSVSQSVSHYAEGGANEVYCNRAVCQSVIMPRWAEPRGIRTVIVLSVGQSVCYTIFAAHAGR